MNASTPPIPNQNPAIQIRGLTKSYGKVRALRGIDLQVQRGEIFGFLGPNGAGKTTTIRCLLDMIRPDGGNALLLGLNPQAEPVAVQARTGYLPGEMQYYDNLTVERQLRFFSDMRQGRVEWRYVCELAERLSLDMKPQIKNLSKGNKQKIGVVQALMHRPELLLLDEPTSGLDPLMQQEVLALLRQANDEGATIFFSSHIMSEVESVAGRVAIIRAGEIVEVAETSSLTRRTLNRLTVRFKRAVEIGEIGSQPGVQILSQDSGNTVTLQVAGDMELVVRALGSLPVLDLETERPSLEEIFMTYYRLPTDFRSLEDFGNLPTSKEK
jgi:ABC-2 type transport system ATP-binding protein